MGAGILRWWKPIDPMDREHRLTGGHRWDLWDLALELHNKAQRMTEQEAQDVYLGKPGTMYFPDRVVTVAQPLPRCWACGQDMAAGSFFGIDWGRRV